MTMECQRMESLMLAVVDGRATREQGERVSAHVAACAACARRMEEMRAVWSSLDAMESVEPSAGFDARLRARMAEQAQPRWRGWLTGRLRLVAVGAALAAVALWFSFRPLARRPVKPEPESQEDFAVVQNLPVLENYDVVANFDALSALPGAQAASAAQQSKPSQQVE